MMSKKKQYRKNRQESKKALVNQFNSLSLMENNDFGNILEDLKSTRKHYGDDSNAPVTFDQIMKDTDDISSIYTDHERNNQLENTLRRIKIREIALESSEDKAQLQMLNSEIKTYEEHHTPIQSARKRHIEQEIIMENENENDHSHIDDRQFEK